jgi:hypothetical protein
MRFFHHAVWLVAGPIVLSALALGGCPGPGTPPNFGCLNVGESCAKDAECCSQYCRSNGKCDLPPVDGGHPAPVASCTGVADGILCANPPACFSLGKCQAGACVGDVPNVGAACAGTTPCYQWVCNAAGACVHRTEGTADSPCPCKVAGECVNASICVKATTSGAECSSPGGPGACSFCVNGGKPAKAPPDCYGNGAVCTP